MDSEDRLVPIVNFLESTRDVDSLVMRERKEQQQSPLRLMSYNPLAPIISEVELDVLQSQEDFDSDGQGVLRIVFSGHFNRWCMARKIRGIDRNIIDSLRSDGINSVPQPLAVQAAEEMKNPARGIENMDRLSDDLLPHPNIISLLCFISPSQDKLGITAVVTEVAEHGTVEYAMGKDFFVTDERLLRWTYQLSLALSYCHNYPHHIIHRDIHPGHVYIFDNGRTVKLGDFFYSNRNSKGPLSANKSDRLPFCAPETLSNSEVTHYSFSADIWSLAMLMYYISHEMSEPFDKIIFNRRDEAKRLIYDGMRPSLRKSLHPVVREIIQSCWVNEARTPDGKEVLPLEPLRPTANQIARHLETTVPLVLDLNF